MERAPRFGQILNPSAAAVRLIETRDERRNDVAQFAEDELRMGADLLERMREHAQKERLERLPRTEQPHV